MQLSGRENYLKNIEEEKEKKMSKFKFSVGPWNVHSGADSYGPATRQEIDFDTKLAKFAEMGL